jgi:hypothetical protein
MNAEQTARERGWQEAHDVETGALVVFHDALRRHYTGRHAWELAATHEGAEGRLASLRALVAEGLTFADAMSVFSEGRDADTLDYVRRAQYKHIHDEGEIEVDDGAVTSASEDGAYVMAWTWVEKREAEGADGN